MTGPSVDTDLTRGEVFDDPHPVYGRLSDELPVHWNPSLRGWVLTRHDDVKAALRDPRLSVEKLEPFAERIGERPQGSHRDMQILARVLADWMVFKDPPRHGELRRAMQNAFMARDVPVLEPMVEGIVTELLESLLPAPGERRSMEFMSAFAHPLPAIVISELFGLPRGERERLKRWSDDLGRFVLGATQAPDKYERAAAAVRAMVARFGRLVAEHRERPRDDFTSLLLRDGAHLGDDEIVHTLVLVLFAGHETTTNLIGSGLLTCLRNPDLLEELTRDPTRIEAAIEEFLRLEGPVQMVFRLAKADVEYGGATIRAGERLHLVLNAANRDPAVFDRPDAIDLDRRRFRHVSFGPGTHMCLGAPLARLVARIALEGFLGSARDLELAPQPLTWRRELIIHGLTSLPIRYARR